MMYRVLAIVGGALALAGCSSAPDWMNLNALKPGPTLDTVSLNPSLRGPRQKPPMARPAARPVHSRSPLMPQRVLPSRSMATFLTRKTRRRSGDRRTSSAKTKSGCRRAQPRTSTVEAHQEARQEAHGEKTGRAPEANRCGNPSSGDCGCACSGSLALANNTAAGQAIAPRNVPNSDRFAEARSGSEGAVPGRYGHYRSEFLYGREK